MSMLEGLIRGRCCQLQMQQMEDTSVNSDESCVNSSSTSFLTPVVGEGGQVLKAFNSPNSYSMEGQHPPHSLPFVNQTKLNP